MTNKSDAVLSVLSIDLACEAVELLSCSDCDSLIGRWTVSSSCGEMSHSPGGLLTKGTYDDVPSNELILYSSANTVSDVTANVWLTLFLKAG